MGTVPYKQIQQKAYLVTLPAFLAKTFACGARSPSLGSRSSRSKFFPKAEIEKDTSAVQGGPTELYSGN